MRILHVLEREFAAIPANARSRRFPDRGAREVHAIAHQGSDAVRSRRMRLDLVFC
jgi:hypothetical protein